MGRERAERFERPTDAPKIDERGLLLVVLGWILIIGAFTWLWVVFFTKQAEIGVWIAIAVGGIGYLLQRAGNRQAGR